MSRFDLHYFSPLFIKDVDKIETRERGSIKAIEKKIDIQKKK